MYDINLMPASRYNVKKIVTTVVIVSISLILSAGLVFYGIVEPLSQQYQVEEMYRLHRSQMARFNTTAEEHATISSNLEQLRLRKDGLSVLFEEKLPSSLVVYGIDGALPRLVYIINTNYSEGSFTLQGHAPSLLEVSEFSMNLKETGLFTTVRILSGVRDMAAGNNSFVINLKLFEE